MGGIKKAVTNIIKKPLQDVGIIKNDPAPAAEPAPAPAAQPAPVIAPPPPPPAAAAAQAAVPTDAGNPETQAEAQAKANRRGKKGVTINRISGGGSGLNV
ncbi:hypothetical protein 10RS306A_gene4601 [Ralstonia phage 10RS306A]|uniref:Tail assembly protein n=1 Tax=Ralstonia phage 10RS306A TaxID=2968818 RepID=A0A977TFB7_9CAUD|nr:hypothetical protein 10RS306A_gene4601 [Ralstonia phage 10RS306A]UYE93702.1 hypothetical protein 10RS305A_4604 [Ralstonia phage 10RS305A]